MSEEAVSVFRDIHGKIAVEWEVKKFFDLPQKHGERILSPTFVLSSARWCLWMCPEGAAKEKSHVFISLYLKRETETTDEHHVSFTCGIKKLDGSVFRSVDFKYKFNERSDSWGKITFLKKSDLSASENVVTPDGSVTFFCVARVLNLDDRTKETASQTTPEGVETLSNNLKDLFHTKRISDIKMNVRDQEFKAHKSVLVARSPVFASMFEHEMAESISGVVEIPDCDSESFESFLLFLYSGKLDFVPSNNLVGLYKTADKYDVQELKEMCCQRLTNQMSVDLVCDVVHLAVEYNEAQLLDTATLYFITNADGIFTTEKWKKFFFESTSIANELLIKMALYHKAEPKSN